MVQQKVNEFDLKELQANENGRPESDYAGIRHAELVADPHDTAVLLMWKKWLPWEGSILKSLI